MKTPTNPPPSPDGAKHTPTPYFVHEYWPKESAYPLYSIGSEGYRDLTGDDIAVAVGITKHEDAHFIVQSCNQSASLSRLEKENQILREALEKISATKYNNCSHQTMRDTARAALQGAPRT